MGESDVLLVKGFLYEISPLSEALSGVDYQSLAASADNICIRALECELEDCQPMHG